MAVAFETKHYRKILPKPAPGSSNQPKKRKKLSIQPLIFESESPQHLRQQPADEIQNFDEDQIQQHQISYNDSLSESPSANNLIGLMHKMQKEREYLNENKIDPFFQMLSNEMSKKSPEEQKMLKIKLFNTVFGVNQSDN